MSVHHTHETHKLSPYGREPKIKLFLKSNLETCCHIFTACCLQRQLTFKSKHWAWKEKHMLHTNRNRSCREIWQDLVLMNFTSTQSSRCKYLCLKWWLFLQLITWRYCWKLGYHECLFRLCNLVEGHFVNSVVMIMN